MWQLSSYRAYHICSKESQGPCNIDISSLTWPSFKTRHFLFQISALFRPVWDPLFTGSTLLQKCIHTYTHNNLWEGTTSKYLSIKKTWNETLQFLQNKYINAALFKQNSNSNQPHLVNREDTTWPKQFKMDIHSLYLKLCILNIEQFAVLR